MKRTFSAIVGVLTAVAILAPLDSSAATGSVIRPVRDCAELIGDLTVPGANIHVRSATVVAGDPEYCKVEGRVDTEINFELRLPTSTYSGRYLQYGCGGRCGLIAEPMFPACGGPHGGDMAVATTDDGHVGKGGFPNNVLDASWAADNRVARDDFWFRAPHVVSLASKRIIQAYYGSGPRRSYFDGCSNGGREAMLLAQRYPHDFDGIIASAPALSIASQWGVFDGWNARANVRPDGTAIITADKLPVLHDAAIAACDGLDGLVDRQIDDPRLCRFDPGSVECDGADAPGCLMPAQVSAARLLYDGPKDAQGRRLHPGWETPGSELGWEGWLTPSPFLPGFGGVRVAADNYLRHLGYPIGTPHSTVDTFEFTVAEFHRLQREAVRGNAMSLDLREFRRSGGKLIMWHGWADQSVPAVGTPDFYQRLASRHGGLRSTQEFARLFMIPSVYHCAFAGDRLNWVDPFPELVAWVERGQAPDRVTASLRDADKNVLRTRPAFPHPLVARYDGSGSIDDAANYVPAQPIIRDDSIDWVGTYLHHIPGPVAEVR